MKRFKKEADVPENFNWFKEKQVLKEKGYITTGKRKPKTTAVFIEQDVFCEKDKKDIILISGEEDLHNCGYFLEKYINGTFVCKRCGKVFAKNDDDLKIRNPKNRKYCDECAKEVDNEKAKKRFKASGKYKRNEPETVVCSECGKIFVRIPNLNKRDICEECYSIRRKKYQAENIKQHRKRDKKC